MIPAAVIFRPVEVLPEIIAVEVVNVAALPDDTYRFLSDAVGGYIECVRLADGVDCWINETGLLDRLPLNPVATAFAHNCGATRLDAVLVGPAVLVGSTPDGETVALPEDWQERIVRAEAAVAAYREARDRRN